MTYFTDGYHWYGLITLSLVLFPTLVVQVFSVRWHMMDEAMNAALGIIHSLMLGLLHRYVQCSNLLAVACFSPS